MSTKIGLLSDTHGLWDERYSKYFSSCDEIWHAGDICSDEIVDKFLSLGKIFRCVRGNADGGKIRASFKDLLRFNVEEISVVLTHVGGHPGKYSSAIVKEFVSNGFPKLFVAGHSHILMVKMDNANNMLYINPGAAGKFGWHKVRTLVRFEIDGDDIKDLEVIELNDSNGL